MSAIINEADRVVLNGEWAEEIIMDVAYSGTENIEEFNQLFEIQKGTFISKEDYYQGMHLTAVIMRKSDGRLFGYPYWYGGGKYGEAFVEENGEEYGFETTWTDNTYEKYLTGPYYVWLPVEAFTIVGYRIAEEGK